MIIRATLDVFWSRETGTDKGKLMMVKRLGKMVGGELGVEKLIPPMGPYYLVYEVGMILACTYLIIYLKKGRHTEHLQWDLTRKALMDWANVYGAASLEICDTIYSRDGRILTSIAYPTRGTWFGKFMRGSKLSMGVIKKQEFGITCNMVKALLEIWKE